MGVVLPLEKSAGRKMAITDDDFEVFVQNSPLSARITPLSMLRWTPAPHQGQRNK
jgi:hypothetical protein